MQTITVEAMLQMKQEGWTIGAVLMHGRKARVGMQPPSGGKPKTFMVLDKPKEGAGG